MLFTLLGDVHQIGVHAAGTHAQATGYLHVKALALGVKQTVSQARSARCGNHLNELK